MTTTISNLRNSVRNSNSAAMVNTSEIILETYSLASFKVGKRMFCDKCLAILMEKKKSWTKICCSSGKINLPILSMPQEGTPQYQIHKLWMDPCIQRKLLRKYLRRLKNALGLASQLVSKDNLKH
ncbi:hypothetical protein BB559_005597 [Furculomyces boomerangus]|uniref:Uncharacterized protein n=2 Tax=Harpellales TaxID=61421 RepID=A0A2T9Y7N3_9FUNG|nr:hypothetical protein BB559_005597 [Furculomyces boomerangus]PVZ98872.1 hypothetical protein BB558_005119 [Smittium angustum]